MKIKISILGLVALCAAVFMPVTPAHAQTDSALVQELVKKGVLTDQEAEDIQADEAKDYATTGASKIILSDAVKNIQFYGDLRLRFEMRDGTVPGGVYQNGSATSIANKGDSETMNRWRYRLRVGVKGEMYDNFFWGIRAATNPTYDRSGNVTFGHGDAAGPFGKGQSLLALDQVYLGWHATSDITLTGGQFANPLYTTNLVWDDNLNPAGAAEQYDHTFGNTEAFATAGQYIYQAAAGNGITNGIGGVNYSNTFMYAEQLGFKYKFNDNTFFKMAGTFYTYSGTVGTSPTTSVASLYGTSPLVLSAPNASPSYFNAPFVGAEPAPYTNVTGINDLAVLEVPMEFDFKVGPGVHEVSSGDPKDMTETTTGWSLPVRIFGDFAYNTEADERTDEARTAIETAESQNVEFSKSTGNSGITLTNSNTGNGTTGSTGMSPKDVAANQSMFNSTTIQGVLNSGKGFLDQSAYQVGVEAGQLKKKGDWDEKLFWQSTGYYAVDPNLIDADIFNAATNLQGVVVAVAHNWTDGLTSTLRYAYAMPVNGQLATPSVNQDLQIGDIKHYNLFQADLMWKF